MLKQKLKATFKKINNVFSDANDFEDEDTPITEEERKKMSKSYLSGILYIAGIVGLAWLLTFIIDKFDSCESEVKYEWTTVNVHDCFYIDIPPMLEIVEGTVSKSGIVRGIWDEENYCFRLHFWAKSMSETIDASSSYAVVYIAYDINPFECVFGDVEVNDIPEEVVVYEKLIEPDLSAVPDFPFTLIGTPKFGNQVINGRNFFVVEYVIQTDGEEYPPVQKKVCYCSSTNGSRIVIKVACDNEEWMDDMMKIIDTIEIP